MGKPRRRQRSDADPPSSSSSLSRYLSLSLSHSSRSSAYTAEPAQARDLPPAPAPSSPGDALQKHHPDHFCRSLIVPFTIASAIKITPHHYANHQQLQHQRTVHRISHCKPCIFCIRRVLFRGRKLKVRRLQQPAHHRNVPPPIVTLHCKAFGRKKNTSHRKVTSEKKGSGA